MIVADTCLVIHLFNQTELTELAQQILLKDPVWILPTLWQEEYANVLSKLARRESRAIDEVLNHFAYVVNELKTSEIIVNTGKALRISMEYKISVYDAHFVSLAMDFNTLLVTEDQEIIKNCSNIALSMQDFLKIV